ncbi:hypothetical protein A1Q1_00729 [Trichosporon asahii var. asahii CBS 2479]|uniref:N-acetyltransferase domain-containing protein n=1 Tax=Trichosporon asahii var. asahii (strain ATCC 90039 / CBS 2479 / JCM 2466 / KCTC 7840 / NBRC 103889/ NCYC 2677 / UAMH 7654) TaxID=1186058 RepID=J6EZJ1_TRIAS|nr:hypothetical protein A1Q1_00729 [Trichosporon asahii var. asahii CBS 2479]EJT50074.1 hypothetical protein A1Q1_00729 [Trichosporon asahii var. asahii CBS 2479]
MSASTSTKLDRSSPEYKRSLTEALRWDHDRREPYLLLPTGDRIVPFRPGIASDIAALFNSPEIGRRLYRLPWPMSVSWAEDWVQDEIQKQEGYLAELVESLPSAPEPLSEDGGLGGGVTQGEGLHKAPGTRALSGMPFKSIRDASGNIVGDIGLTPSDADPDTYTADMWHLGYVLAESATGRGLMIAAVGAVLAWAKEWMGVKAIEAIVENDNPGSIGVLLATGFERVGDTVTDWPEEKGGGKRYGGRWIWKADA